MLRMCLAVGTTLGGFVPSARLTLFRMPCRGIFGRRLVKRSFRAFGDRCVVDSSDLGAFRLPALDQGRVEDGARFAALQTAQGAGELQADLERAAAGKTD